MDDEALEFSGFRLHQISPVEIPGSPLEPLLTFARESEEDFELWGVRVPGNRSDAALLYRPTLPEVAIAWGNQIAVRGSYEVPEALAMFAHHLGSESGFTPESGGPPVTRGRARAVLGGTVTETTPPKRRGRPPKAKTAAPVPTQGPPPFATLTFSREEVKVLLAFATSCAGFEYELENSLSPEEHRIGDRLLERLKYLRP